MTEGAQQAAGFETDIKPFFRERDRSAMLRACDLWSYDDVRTHGPQMAQRRRPDLRRQIFAVVTSFRATRRRTGRGCEDPIGDNAGGLDNAKFFVAHRHNGRWTRVKLPNLGGRYGFLATVTATSGKGAWIAGGATAWNYPGLPRDLVLVGEEVRGAEAACRAGNVRVCGELDIGELANQRLGGRPDFRSGRAGRPALEREEVGRCPVPGGP
jgi:hypothetical protein